MFHNDDEALRRMEEALLAEDKIPEEPELEEEAEFEEDPAFEEEAEADDEEELIIRNYANHYRAYTNQPSDVDLEQYSQQVLEPRRKKDRINLCLVLLAVILTVCIAMVVLWFLLRMGLL